MVSMKLIPAIAAVGLAAASTSPCSSDVTINSQSDVSNIASCQTVTGSVTIGSNAGDIDLSGPTEITGDLTLQNNGVITSLGSTSLRTLGGNFQMDNVTVLSNLAFGSLTSVGSIAWQTLPALGSLNFGTPGVTKASSVVISDTFLSSMDGIDLVSVDTINLNNNGRLSQIVSQLGNVSTLFRLNANGLHLSVSLPNLIWAAELDFSNVTDLSLPSLAVVNDSIQFNSNFFTSFSAPNLTSTTTGDISFVSNGALTNLSFPALTSVGGAVVVANNTALSVIEAFPQLQQVGGAIAIRGNFSKFSFPKLKDVKGTADIESTTNIDSSCTPFMAYAPSSQGGNGVIQGQVDCTSDNANANNNTGSGSTGGAGGSSSSGSGSSSTKGNSAAGLNTNAAVVFGFTILAGVASLFL